MGGTRSTPVTHQGVTYPSKTAASVALSALGMKAAEIAAAIGSTKMAVEQALKKARRQAAMGTVDATPNVWTPEKRDKVRRLFGHTMVHIADAVQVPAAELLRYVLHGVIPPSQAVKDPGDIRWVPPSGMGPEFDGGEQKQLPPPVEEPDHIEADSLVVPAAYVDDPEAVFNILMLTDADVTQEDVAGWTVEQRKLAEEWGGATHLSASDHDDIVVPPRPDFVPRRPLQIGKNSIMPEVAPSPAPRFPAAAETPAKEPARPVSTKAPAGTVIAVATGMFPGGCVVRLKRDDGHYLKENLQGFTRDLKSAWDGGRQQFDAVKMQMPKVVAKLSFEVVA